MPDRSIEEGYLLLRIGFRHPLIFVQLDRFRYADVALHSLANRLGKERAVLFNIPESASLIRDC